VSFKMIMWWATIQTCLIINLKCHWNRFYLSTSWSLRFVIRRFIIIIVPLNYKLYSTSWATHALHVSNSFSFFFFMSHFFFLSLYGGNSLILIIVPNIYIPIISKITFNFTFTQIKLVLYFINRSFCDIKLFPKAIIERKLCYYI
jgi:hypothetical protein